MSTMNTATINEHIEHLADTVDRQPDDLTAIRALYQDDDEHLVDYVSARVMRHLEEAEHDVSARQLIVAELRGLMYEAPDAPDDPMMRPR